MELESMKNTARDNVDLIVLFVVVGYLIYISFDLPPRTRQFPLIFLVFAFLLVVIEMVVLALPDHYTRRFKILTEGLASEMEVEEMTEDEEEEEEYTAEDKIPRWHIVGLLSVFVATAYLFGFVVAIPIFVFPLFALTTRDWPRALLLTIGLMVIVYYLFGVIMNVPVLEPALW